jgi:branched-chain amino acid aminotransferase
VPLSEARVPLTDEGFVRGDGCFEVVRCYAGRPFALDEHLARMARSAAALQLPLDGVAEAVANLSDGFEGYVRVMVTRGPPPAVYAMQEHHHQDGTPMRLRSLAAPWLAPLGSTVLAGAKTLSYANAVAARRLAQGEGYDDALLLDRDGVVLEGPTNSVLWVESDRVVAPALRLGVLDSISRRVVGRLTPVTEVEATLDRLMAADEVFVTSTAHEVTGVATVDDRTWPAPGPVTARLAQGFRDHVTTAR